MPCQPKMMGCKASCLHRQLVSNYIDVRDARDALRQDGRFMQHEDDDFDREHPVITFKQWLISHARGRHD